MKKTSLRISIVIPVYNEQSHIGACLRAIAAQEKRPYEVTVVNNRSTDNTVEIATQFPFVTVINAEKKGVVHARDQGYDYASGDIIGRIDADTLLPRDWTLKLEKIFEDQKVKAVSGSLHFYDIGWSKLLDSIDGYFRARMAKLMDPNDRVFLLGSNMAIRKDAWVSVRNIVCRHVGTHEDLDLALHLSEAQQKVVYRSELLANISLRRLDTNTLDFIKYVLMSPLTYYRHKAKEHRHMYPLIAVVFINYITLRLLFRAFDTRTNRVSFKQLINHPSMARVNPATYL
jgi:glycosyltransferase involved in cell wall biosynthesis